MTTDRRRTAENSVWQLVTLGGRAAFSIVTIYVLTQSLGPGGFGVYAGTIAVVSIVAPVLIAGAGHVLLADLARGRSDSGHAAGASFVVAGVGSLLTISAAALIAPLLTDRMSPTAAALLAAGEILTIWIIDLVSRAWMGLGMFRASALTVVSASAVRSVAVVIFAATADGDPGFIALALLISAGGVVASIGNIAVLVRSLGGVTSSGSSAVQLLRRAAPFGIGQSGATVFNDADKAMLLDMRGDAVAGAYAAGYRVVGYAALPLGAILGALYPRFFKSGMGGDVESTRRLARRFFPGFVLAALALGGALLVIAPLVPTVLGEEYRDSVSMIRWLALLPLMQVSSSLAGDTLTGADRHGLRTIITIAAASMNVALNLITIRLYSWQGAIGATYATELVLIVLLIVARRRVTKSYTDGGDVGTSVSAVNEYQGSSPS